MCYIYIYKYICFLAAPTLTLPEAAAIAPTRRAAGEKEKEPVTTPVTTPRRSPRIGKFKFIHECQSNLRFLVKSQIIFSNFVIYLLYIYRQVYWFSCSPYTHVVLPDGKYQWQCPPCWDPP